MDTLSNWGSVILNIPSYVYALSTGGTGTAPPDLVPEVQYMKSPDYPEAKRVKVRYGPFRVPPRQEVNFNNLYWQMEGISTAFRLNIRRPCDKTCMILGIEADLEYADGSSANTSTKAIFHHTVLLNIGPSVVEPTCNQPFLENIFMAGNEKTPTNYALPKSKVKSGYVITPRDTFLINVELQNLSDKEKYVWETIYYDIVEGVPKDYQSAHIVWLTVGTVENPSLAMCRYYGSGEFPWGPTNLTKTDQPLTRTFQEHSALWHSDKDGTIMQSGGHLHDGGLDVILFKNNTPFCDSVAQYAAGPPKHSHGPKEKRQIDGGKYENTELSHITEVNTCKFYDGLPLEKGDILHIQANYDFDKWRGMKNSEGKLDQVSIPLFKFRQLLTMHR
jgi:hypothetical protein